MLSLKSITTQIVLVRGKIIKVEGKVVVGSLGLAGKDVAPVLMEPIGRGVGGTVKVSGDYKVTYPPVRVTCYPTEQPLWGKRGKPWAGKAPAESTPT